jgi:hypothetical protein
MSVFAHISLAGRLGHGRISGVSGDGAAVRYGILAGGVAVRHLIASCSTGLLLALVGVLVLLGGAVLPGGGVLRLHLMARVEIVAGALVGGRDAVERLVARGRGRWRGNAIS